MYDTAAKGVGQLGREVSALESFQNTPQFTRTYTYDEFSRPADATTTIDGTNYITKQHYDDASRVTPHRLAGGVRRSAIDQIDCA